MGADTQELATAGLPEDPTALPPEDGYIHVLHARTHNLKGIDVDLPRSSFVVVSGPSGRSASIAPRKPLARRSATRDVAAALNKLKGAS